MQHGLLPPSIAPTMHPQIIVDPLDSRLGKHLDNEDFQHGYHGLPIHQFLSSLTDSSSLKDCPPPRVLLLGQGEADPKKPVHPGKAAGGS